MRIANVRGRLSLVTEEGAIDVARASGARFGPDPQSPFAQWDEFAPWAAQLDGAGAEPYRPEELGPPVVTLDELDDPDDLELGCRVNGEEVQKGRTSDLIFSVPELIARLSSVVTLRPGDLIFTGTPSGVGAGRTPPRFLRPGDVL